MEEKAVSIGRLVNAVDIAANKLPYMEDHYGQAQDQAEEDTHH
jgi:hypothetical protein